MMKAKDGWYLRRTRDWEVLTTKQMTISHIKNCIKYIKKYGMRYHWIIEDYDSDRQTEFYDWPNRERDNETIKLLEEELRLRWEI